jgi:hypothetical protein
MPPRRLCRSPLALLAYSPFLPPFHTTNNTGKAKPWDRLRPPTPRWTSALRYVATLIPIPAPKLPCVLNPQPIPTQSLSSRIQQLELATGAGTPAPGPKGEGHSLLASLQASGAGGLEAEQLMAERDKVCGLSVRLCGIRWGWTLFKK